MPTLKRVLTLISCCLIFYPAFIQYGHAQSKHRGSSREEMWLKEDNFALRERLKELQNNLVEQNRIQLELEETLEKLKQKKDSPGQVAADDSDSLKSKVDLLNSQIVALEKEKDILETMLEVNP